MSVATLIIRIGSYRLLNMVNKRYIIELVSELQYRSKQLYQDVVAKIDSSTDLAMTIGVFQSKFRRFPERHTTYDVDEVKALIDAFRSKKTGKPVCTPFESILFCSWAGLGIGSLGNIGKLYPHNIYQHALNLSLQLPIDELNWFDEETRVHIKSLLKQAEFEAFDRLIPKEDVTNSGHSETRSPDWADISKSKIDIAPISFNDVVRMLQYANKSVDDGKFDTAEATLYKLLHKVDHHQREQVSDLFQEIGTQQIRKSQYEAAEKNLTQALKLTSNFQSIQQAVIQANLGSSAYYQGKIDAANRHYVQALKFAESSSETNVMAFLHNSIGLIANEQMLFVQAQRHYLKALQLAQKINHTERLGYIYLNQAVTFIQTDNDDNAIKTLQLGLSQANQLNNTELFVHLNWNKAVIHNRSGKINLGEQILKQNVYIAEDNGHIWLTACMLIELGKLYIQSSIPLSAINAFLEAVVFAQKLQNSELINRATYGVMLSVLTQRYVLGTNNPNETTNYLKMHLPKMLLEAIDTSLISVQLLLRAEHYFQHGLMNYPDLSRYHIIFGILPIIS